MEIYVEVDYPFMCYCNSYHLILFSFFFYYHFSGFIESDMTKDLDTEKLLPFIPLKRFGTADEVAGNNLLFIYYIFCL